MKFSVFKENGKYDARYHTASIIRLGGSLILSVNVCLSIVLPNHLIKSFRHGNSFEAQGGQYPPVHRIM